jgi:hypothetical protein
MSVESDYLKRIVAVLKVRFNNLAAEELIDLASKILDVLPVEGLKR